MVFDHSIHHMRHQAAGARSFCGQDCEDSEVMLAANGSIVLDADFRRRLTPVRAAFSAGDLHVTESYGGASVPSSFSGFVCAIGIDSVIAIRMSG